MRVVVAALSVFAPMVAATNEVGLKFLEENKVKEDVVALPSGLQYRVLKRGSGDSHPTASSPCLCHYEGRVAQEYPEGPTFDSSYARGEPTTFAPNQVIKGWTEAMQLMVEGDKWELFIPSELGYGDRGSPPKIGGGDVLVFTMEIIEIKGATKPASRCNVSTLEDCTDQERAYVEKLRVKSADELKAEVARIKRMPAKDVAESKRAWMSLRIKLITAMLATHINKDEP